MGRKGCQTGDCADALCCMLSATLAVFNLEKDNTPYSYDISVIDGFTLPMDVSCSGAGGSVIGARTLTARRHTTSTQV
uniref:Uncharacterized protein n=1 Tax=Aegilops tauschii TaxID=37682 RepID=M8C4N9_AEGTA